LQERLGNTKITELSYHNLKRKSSDIPYKGYQKFDDLPPRGATFWQTIGELIYDEYFNRLWVLQEVAFAKRIKLLCGNHEISWTQMDLLFGQGVHQIEGYPI